MATGSSQYYPLPGFLFSVEFTGGSYSGETAFQEVSGLKFTVDTEEVTVGGILSNTFKLPGIPKYQNLVLKRGILTDSNLRNWIMNAVTNFQYQPVNVQIALLNEKKAPAMTWSVNKAYPVSWEVDAFNSMENKVAVETLELAYETFTIKSSGS